MAKCYNKIYLKKQKITADCGKCLNCIENKKRDRAVRSILEMQEFKYKWLVTFTYDNMELALNGTKDLVKQDIILYKKRLRETLRRNLLFYNRKSLSFIGCGEYGGITSRAHYHMVIASDAHILHYIKRLWKKGHVQVESDVLNGAIGYTAGYTDKKRDIRDKLHKEQPFAFTSRGIGKTWIHEAIAKNKINPEHYYIELPSGRYRLPKYFKDVVKRQITGTMIRYRKEEEREKIINNLKETYKWLQTDHILQMFNDIITKKYIDINTKLEIDYETYKNEREIKYKEFIEKVRANYNKTDREIIEFAYLRKKYGNSDVFATKNTMKNQTEENKIRLKEIMLENLYKKQKIKMKMEAINRYWKKVNTRTAV